jgi:hypothetical protein
MCIDSMQLYIKGLRICNIDIHRDPRQILCGYRGTTEYNLKLQRFY